MIKGIAPFAIMQFKMIRGDNYFRCNAIKGVVSVLVYSIKSYELEEMV